MTGGSLGLRTSSYGSLQQQFQNGFLQATQASPVLVRKPSKMLISSSREKERLLPFICRYVGRRRVAMLLLVVLALLVFVFGSFTVNKESNISLHIGSMTPYRSDFPVFSNPLEVENSLGDKNSSGQNSSGGNDQSRSLSIPPPATIATLRDVIRSTPRLGHQCENFTRPPPPPPSSKKIGPRPCEVCYLPVEDAIASMPSSPSKSPVLRNLTYVHDENPIKTETHGGSDFGGYPSMKQRNESFDIKESMTVHCGFVKGSKPGDQSGFDIDEADLMELEQFHEVIVASAIFGNYDNIQQPRNISEAARKNIPFYMFIDEKTEAVMKNSSDLDGSKKFGFWRIIVVRNIPYSDPRRNGKVPKLLLHRIFPNVRYSIWIDGKLQLVVDPYQILERFLWRENANIAISRHYKRYDVFVEAEANKNAGKFDNASIDYQIDFYRREENLTAYNESKLPITSDVPEGCVIVKEHIPITNLFTCLWFNEVDRFTPRDQLSFSTVRDKIMSKVSWSINMFEDCERRNFVIQDYHKGVTKPPPRPRPPRRPRPVGPVIRHPPPLPPPRPRPVGPVIHHPPPLRPPRPRPVGPVIRHPLPLRPPRPRPVGPVIRHPPPLSRSIPVVRSPIVRSPVKKSIRRKGERRSGQKRHRKVIAGSRDNNSF